MTPNIDVDALSIEEAAEIAAACLLVVFGEAGDRLSGAERDQISYVRHICHEIEDGDR